jgi:glucokinase
VAVLVGDIGGTNTRLAIFEHNQMVHRASFVNAEMAGFDECLSQFLETTSAVICAAVFGGAGPVDHGRLEMTNLNWLLTETELVNRLDVPVRLLNDFHIQALGTLGLTDQDYESLGGVRVDTPRQIAVIGAGTGLGEAFLTFTDGGWIVVPGEGGHKRFAPKNEREVELLRQLWVQFPEHVSVERVVSGPGIVNVFKALGGRDFAQLGDQDPARTITEQALARSCDLSVETLEIFVDTLADEAANLALQNRANCVYVSGGIPPRVLPIIRARFRGAFEAKGRYRKLLTQVEVRVVDHDDIALEGAAYAAERLVGQGLAS